MAFASKSLARHLLRGVIGFAALVAGLTLGTGGTPAALALLVVTPIAWRGCPTCWTVGLLATLARGNTTARSCSR